MIDDLLHGNSVIEATFEDVECMFKALEHCLLDKLIKLVPQEIQHLAMVTSDFIKRLCYMFRLVVSTTRHFK